MGKWRPPQKRWPHPEVVAQAGHQAGQQQWAVLVPSLPIKTIQPEPSQKRRVGKWTPEPTAGPRPWGKIVAIRDLPQVWLTGNVGSPCRESGPHPPPHTLSLHPPCPWSCHCCRRRPEESVARGLKQAQTFLHTHRGESGGALGVSAQRLPCGSVPSSVCTPFVLRSPS